MANLDAPHMTSVKRIWNARVLKSPRWWALHKGRKHWHPQPILCTTLYRNLMQASNFGSAFDQLFLRIFLWNFHRKCLSTSSIPWRKKGKNDQNSNQGRSCLKGQVHPKMRISPSTCLCPRWSLQKTRRRSFFPARRGSAWRDGRSSIMQWPVTSIVPRTEIAAAKQCLHRFGREDGSVLSGCFSAQIVF